MESNPFAKINTMIFDYFAEWKDPQNGAVGPLRPRRCGEIIRYHIDDFAESGDLSIATNAQHWESFCQRLGCKLRRDQERLMEDPQQREDLMEISKNWLMPIKCMFELQMDRYGFSLDRAPVIRYALTTILKQGMNYGHSEKSNKTLVLSLNLGANMGQPDGPIELRHYRLKKLYEIVKRLVECSNWRMVTGSDASADSLLVNVEAQRCTLTQRQGHVCLVSGPVLEPGTKTATDLDLEDYLKIRSTHMRLMAVHRSGVRPVGFGSQEGLMRRLGEAAVIVDLFSVRHASAACVVRSGMGSSKGASYILYNSARIETLLRSFDSQVKAGIYDPLPPLEMIDLSILEDEMDWQLIFACLLNFPEVLESTIDQLEHGLVGVHLLIRYLENLATVFSRYYRQKKVLVQKRDQLVPILYARITLVKAVRVVMNQALSVLGIKPVDYV
nr:DALR anticodon-binding domain-containing protein 3 [Drosophila bipectinata]